MSTRVGINGFGRIGRNFFRAFTAKGADLEVVAVNDITDPATIAHLLKYDTVFGRLGKEVKSSDEGFSVDGNEVRVLSERDPGSLPWGDLGVEVVVESTGLFTKRADAAKHLDAGAKKVIISARRRTRTSHSSWESTTMTTIPDSTASSLTRRVPLTVLYLWRKCCRTTGVSRRAS